MKKKPIVIYLRVSKKDMEEENQLPDCEAYARELGWKDGDWDIIKEKISAFKNPSTIWNIPAKTTATKKFSKPPSVPIEVKTMAARPAAGPLTPILEPLSAPTRIPPIIPAMTPENKGAPLARATPRHKGSATKKTTTLAGKSLLNCWARLTF